MRRSKIQIDRTVGSKNQNFNDTQLGFWPQLLSKGFLNIMTL